ncbi:hypothetical protein WMY93_021839 [Mugilogobius chulae]|uniref:TGF-beta family profile domain-containing protein n=1 Tax=Mugilogobius chulae TaxID=88201 RepID=A0AAW0NN08_9GOBI
MSFACVFIMIFLGSSVAFVLQPSQGESNHPGFHQSCQSLSLQSIKKELLKSLNLQAEPQVPVGLLDSVQEQWKRAFSSLSEGSEVSVSDDGNMSNSLTCCSMTSEVFMKDLGWDNWVIYPSSLTITKCRVCIREENTVLCPQHAHRQNGQVHCCHATSHKMVPIVYMDEFGNVVISSVPLTQGCGCDTSNNQPPINKPMRVKNVWAEDRCDLSPKTCDDGGYCWSTYIKCQVEEHFDRAFVVLPVNTSSSVEVTTSPAATKLSVHPSLPLISESCGFLFEVTPHFSTENTDNSFCIQLRTQQQLSVDPGDLRCPPYLVVLWQSNSNQAHAQSGG